MGPVPASIDNDDGDDMLRLCTEKLYAVNAFDPIK